jgi:hypothetical protein
MGQTMGFALVLDATNTEQEAKHRDAPVYAAVVGEHVPEVGVVTNALRGTPPVAGVADIVETAIVIADTSAARQGSRL